MIPGLVQHRDLDREELSELVCAFAARPDLWRSAVRHDADRRVFTRLWHDHHVTAWLICWLDGHDTGFHDHGGSSGAVAVVEGAVVEERLRRGHVPASHTLTRGATFTFGPAEIHRVLHPGTGIPAVTLHAYSPPLGGMSAYERSAAGRVERRWVPEDEELRPLRQPARTGSSAASLTSVSASSSAGSESRTTPTPA